MEVAVSYDVDARAVAITKRRARVDSQQNPNSVEAVKRLPGLIKRLWPRPLFSVRKRVYTRSQAKM